MKRAALVGGTLVLLLAGAAYYFRPPAPERPHPLPPKPPPPPLNRMLKVPPARMLDAYHETYRVPPDKRLLRAAGELQRLFSGKETPPAAAEFQNGQWEIKAGAEVLG